MTTDYHVSKSMHHKFDKLSSDILQMFLHVQGNFAQICWVLVQSLQTSIEFCHAVFHNMSRGVSSIHPNYP